MKLSTRPQAVPLEPFKKPAALPKRFVEELSALVGDDNVEAREIELRAHASAIYFPSIYTRRREGSPSPPPPQLVVYPFDRHELASVIKLCLKRNIPLVPYGQGSGVCGGAIPLRGGVVIDLSRLDRVIEIDEYSATAQVECGINGEVLERRLNEAGFTLGHFPSSIYCSSLGGWLATRSAGQLSTKYGKIEDMVISLEAILPDGSVVGTRTAPRQAAGPEYKDMLIGAEGTLGIITEATLRVHPLPDIRIFNAWGVKDFKSGAKAIRKVVQAGVKPAAVRLYDEADTMLNSQHAGSGLKEGCLLVFTWEGVGGVVNIEANLGADILRAEGATDLGPGPARHWWEHRYDISYNSRKVLPNAGMIVDTFEVVALWKNLDKVYRKVRAALAKKAVLLCHLSHAYPEGGCMYFTITKNVDEAETVETHADLIEAGLRATLDAGGVIAHHHGIGLTKGAALRAQQPLLHDVLIAIKKQLDPHNLFNPGKLGMPATPDYE